MNKTNIEWVVNPDGTNGFTWNPITGCLQQCWYCYARGIANRFRPQLPQGDDCEQPGNGLHVVQGNKPFRYGFEPTFHPSRLLEPQKARKGSTIFVGSMADIFGRWIPPEWIKQILESIHKCPQHTFLFLTKNGSRMCTDNYDGIYKERDVMNTWYGQTFTGSDSKPNNLITNIPNGRHFLSFEPLLGDWIPDLRGLYVNWIIIGSLNRNGKAVHPSKGGTQKEWVLKIIAEAERLRIPLFIKSELISLYPDIPQKKDIPYLNYQKLKQEERALNASQGYGCNTVNAGRQVGC